ncbi:hypothetical protein SAMN05216338_104551 [Bradyrhizobium sp. Rc2d]|nr:hypothetical protein SAMN05216338_104551 [Bradyrhizobium sp. Rc2d]
MPVREHLKRIWRCMPLFMLRTAAGEIAVDYLRPIPTLRCIKANGLPRSGALTLRCRFRDRVQATATRESAPESGSAGEFDGTKSRHRGLNCHSPGQKT